MDVENCQTVGTRSQAGGYQIVAGGGKADQIVADGAAIRSIDGDLTDRIIVDVPGSQTISSGNAV